MTQHENIDPMPRNERAEHAIIGRLLIDNLAIDEVAGHLLPDDFHNGRRAEMYRHILALHHKGDYVDAVSLDHTLGHDDEQFNYLTHLAERDYVVFGGDIEHLAKIVTDEALRRKLMWHGSETMQDAAQDTDAKAVLERAESRLMDIGKERGGGEAQSLETIMIDYRDAFTRLEQSRGEMRGLRTGFHGLDFLTRGLREKKLYVIAGRPGTGKTSLALTMAYNMAFTYGKKIAFFSLEMGKDELMERLISMRAHVGGQSLSTPWELDNDERERVHQAMDDLEQGHIYIDETPALSIASLRSKARRLVAKHGIDCIFVDYLQLMQANDSGGKRISTPYQEVTEISRALKALSKELDVPVVALAQLSRAVESRPSKVPMLSDLRDSGAIEQDADVVMFLYCDELYNPETERKGITDVIVAKQRGGPVNSVPLHFEAKYTQFCNIVTQLQEVRV